MSRKGRKFDPERIAYLESEERRLLFDPPRLLRRLDVRKGWIIVDVGCGPGLFTFPLAEMVGKEGRVYGVDTEPRMIKRLRERIADAHSQNVFAILSTEESIPLPDRIADFALMSTVLHELDGISILLEVGRILKPRGILGIIDWKKKTEPIGPPKEHRLDEEEAAEILREAGFEPEPPLDIGPSHFGFRAKKT